MSLVTPISLLRLTRSTGALSPERADDVVVTESPLEVRVEGRSIAVVMRTPGHDRELAAGFLLSEGVISTRQDLFDITTCDEVPADGGAVEVLLARPEGLDMASLTRHVFTSSSCGVCGKASIESAMRSHAPLPVPPAPSLAAELLFDLPEKQRAAQPVFSETGGLHASALFDFTGELLITREDAGRHNALDKVTGAMLLAGRLPLSETILMLSGRTSFELVQKALAARIPVIAAVGAPSSLAVQLAQECGITLCGFLRSGRCNIYTHPERLLGV